MQKQLIGNRNLIRAINRSSVLNTIKTLGPLSRTEIAKHTGLSAATITAISADLLESGLIFEKEAGDSSGGRKPILLALNPRGGFVIGAKLTEDHISAALTDLEATVLARQTIPLAEISQQAVLDSLCQVVNDILAANHVDRRRFYGIGVGLAGIVDPGRGLLRQSPIFGWDQVPVADLLCSSVGAPVYIDNDVNTLTLTELWFGRGQGIDNFLTVTVGRGIGLGIVLGGKLYTGARGGAGEFGHTVVDPAGPLCACKKRGCLETYISDPALLRQAQAAGLDISTVEMLIGQAEAGDPVARLVLAQAGEILGRAIANLVNVLVPQLIIISGEGVRAGEWLFGPMRRSLVEQVMPPLRGDVDLQIDAWDEYAWARGAAGLVLRHLFESPVDKERLAAA
jgi:predicted NBD/HSP70 family sugar kinase